MNKRHPLILAPRQGWESNRKGAQLAQRIDKIMNDVRVQQRPDRAIAIVRHLERAKELLEL